VTLETIPQTKLVWIGPGSRQRIHIATVLQIALPAESFLDSCFDQAINQKWEVQPLSPLPGDNGGVVADLVSPGSIGSFSRTFPNFLAHSSIMSQTHAF
jgi:hypothetical protein